MSAYIYHGPWVNWSHGLIRGATITLSEREGGLLTAFIATFVTIVGAELWKIICYVCHQLRSEPTPQDGLYHQQQVIFKNTAGPAGTAWLFLVQAWYWAGRARRSLLRTLPWAIFGIVYVVAIGVTAIFSSQISKSPGPMRLLIGGDCGQWLLNMSAPSRERLNAYNTKMANESILAATYAKACYGGSHDPLACGKLPVPAITWTANANASCPFESGTCLYGDTAAFQATSKLIDSQLDLGINAPSSGRIQIEKTTTCAPLHTKGFADYITAAEDPNGYYGRDNDTIFRYYYGELLNTSNETYYYNDHASFDQNPYSLSAVQANAGPVSHDGGAFIPVQALNTTTADLSLMFIAGNSVTYKEACQDPVFSATELVESVVNGIQLHYYPNDRYVNVVGCAEQYRLCNPISGVCTDKLGIMQHTQTLVENDDGLELNALQNATAYRLLQGMQFSSVYYQVYTRLGGALRATESLQSLSQPFLPPNQWHIEVGSWFDTGLARLQQKTQEYATGPGIVPSGSYILRPNLTAHPEDLPYKTMCYSQLVNDSSDTMSFSVVGLALLLILGVIIIFVSVTMDTIVGWLQVRFKKGLHAHLEWKYHDKLELQSLLHGEMKLGHWDGSKRLPITHAMERFVGPIDRELNVMLSGRNSETEDGVGAQLVQENYETKYDGNRY